MPVRSNLAVLLAQVNVERTKRGLKTISVRQHAAESNISHTVLGALVADRSQRIDYATIDKLLTYLNNYFPTTFNDLFLWVVDEDPDE